TNEILDFCARDPIERVFLEEVARRSLGRFVGLLDGEELVGLCHVGVNAVPSGRGCAAFARDVVRASPRMLIGEAGAVGELWEEDGLIRFKAEASAWTPSAVQLQQVWVDPPARRRGYATRALRDLLRDLLARVPAVCLFVRGENIAAIRLYETVGMKHVLDYRSVLL